MIIVTKLVKKLHDIYVIHKLIYPFTGPSNLKPVLIFNSSQVLRMIGQHIRRPRIPYCSLTEVSVVLLSKP